MQEKIEPVVELKDISKKFGGIYALNGVSFDLRNEIHSIVGHNGAGKSTLVKILMGALQQDNGEIYLNGKPVSFNSPREAQQNRIAMVWQELANFPNLSITENLQMRRFVHYQSGGIDWSANHTLTEKYLHKIALDLDPRMLMEKLPLAQQQLVEFAKALSYDPSVLILDEPTSALSCAEQEILYEKIRLIKSLGVAVVFISHKLDEIKALSDRITVLRDGHKIFTKNADELNKDEIIASIVGKPAERKQKSKNTSLRKQIAASSPVTVEVQNLSMDRSLENISFRLHKGEMLGISGVSGSGISEIGKILFGMEDAYTGTILLEGKPYASSSPLEAVSKGFGYVPKDRKEEGIIPEMSVGDNIVLSTLEQICISGFVNKKRKNNLVNKIMDTTDLRPRNQEITISSLSGGNQQKVVMARWICKESRVLILDEPTRGVDVGAIQKIYSLIRDLADKGMSVIVISSEFEEVHAATDRMIILNKGKIVGEIDPAVDRWEDAFAMAIN